MRTGIQPRPRIVMGKASAWQWRPVKSFTHANVLRLLIGVWILNAPFLREELASSDQTFWNQLIVGSCVVVLAAMRMVFAREAGIFRWAHLLLGVWLIASPWIFAYVDEQAAFWNSAVSGALIAALALWSLVR